VKGLAQVRRDWCDLSREIGEKLTDVILTGNDRATVIEQIHDYLKLMGDRMRAGEVAFPDPKIPVEKFIIRKQLTKRPEEYPDAKAQPHVVVAMAMAKVVGPDS
jgi:DNA polymerase alpha subunit A